MKKDIIKQIKDSGREFLGNKDLARSAPVNKGELVFFKIGKLISDDELEKEYEKRGLKPASIQALVDYDQNKLYEMNDVGTHWKDAKGKWCFAVFDRWYDERQVSVNSNYNDWGDITWFAGIRKSNTESL